MFTVIICSKVWQESVKRNCSYILDLLNNDTSCAVCLWNPEADTFEEALPDLPGIIAGKPRWRALVIQDADTFGMDYINKRNPFDIVGSTGALQDFGETTILRKTEEIVATAGSTGSAVAAVAASLGSDIQKSEQAILHYRTIKQDHYRTALTTPLTRLGIWLYGIPAHSQPEYPSAWPDLFQKDTQPIDANYYCELLDHNILASEIEQFHTMQYRYDAMSSAFLPGAMIPRKPDMILAVSERNASFADEVFKTSAEHHEELEYSNFCDDNMYCDQMRFVFFDMHYENNTRIASDFLSFASLISVYAKNEIPQGVLRGQHVYKTGVVLDPVAIRTLFERYLIKLKKTKTLLFSLVRKHQESRQKKDLSEQDAIDLFEADVTVPVVVRSAPEKEELMAKYKSIGLAQDCPQDEYHYWYHQITEITQKFIRFLREPRRAVKVAVKDDLREQNRIDDERIWNLDEFQLQNIQLKLQDDEKKMMESATIHLFKTKEFTKRMDKADQKIRSTISRRISRKKTLVVGLIALIAYFIGFLPLLFSNLNTLKSELFSLLLTGIVLAAFMGIGLVYLFVLRHRLIKLFKHFNSVMSDILTEIENGLKAFSRYISCICNVMREFSVSKQLSQKEDKQLNVLQNHIRDVDRRMAQARELIAFYDMGQWTIDDDIQPYPYDFRQMVSYDYEMPYTETATSVEFLLKGHNVDCPMDYIEKITIEREELYD